MVRWRAPVKPGSPYITLRGAQQLRAELHYLWRTRRPQVVKALTAAAAEGDRSENAEYTERKKQLVVIDRRIRYLSKRIDSMKIVNQAPQDLSKIRFGAWIRLGNGSDDNVEYRIVGSDETDNTKGYISVDSPVACALLGKSAGDQVEIKLPERRARLEVIRVWYEQQ